MGRAYCRNDANVKLTLFTEVPDFSPRQRQVRAFIGAGLAALPLFDALVLAVANQPLGSLLCVLVFFLLPHFQRWIKPT